MNEFQAVGQRIAKLRGELTKQDFSARLGVDRKTVERWEAGERLPDGSKLLKLMTEFGADVNFILTGQPSQTAPTQGALSPRQCALLDNYEHADASGKAIIEAAASAAAQPGPVNAPGSEPAKRRKRAA